MACCVDCEKKQKTLLLPSLNEVKTNRILQQTSCCKQKRSTETHDHIEVQPPWQNEVYQGITYDTTSKSRVRHAPGLAARHVDNPKIWPYMHQPMNPFNMNKYSQNDPVWFPRREKLTNDEILCRFVNRLNHNHHHQSLLFRLPEPLENGEKRMELTEDFGHTYIRKLPEMTFRRSRSQVAPFHAYMTFHD